MEKGMCACPHHKVVPVFVVLFGLVFLLGALGSLSEQVVAVLWPIVIIAAGLTRIFENKCKCC